MPKNPNLPKLMRYLRQISTSKFLNEMKNTFWRYNHHCIFKYFFVKKNYLLFSWHKTLNYQECPKKMLLFFITYSYKTRICCLCNLNIYNVFWWMETKSNRNFYFVFFPTLINSCKGFLWTKCFIFFIDVAWIIDGCH